MTLENNEPIGPTPMLPTPPTYPMSYEQEAIWLQDQFRLGPSRYVESWIQRLRGPVDVRAVEAALTAIVARQEALRSRLDDRDGFPRQTVLPPSAVTVTVRHITPDDLDDELTSVVRTPLSLNEPPLLRATLLCLAEDDTVLAVAIHHAVIDGWGYRLLDEQFSAAYRAALAGEDPLRALPEIPLQFGEYAARQRHDTEMNSREHLDHWRAVLADAPLESTFPADRPRPAVPGYLGGEVEFRLDATLGSAIRQLARAERATPFVVLAAALTGLLNRLGGQDDVVLGTPVSRRTGTEVKSLIALLTDVMPLRQRVTPDAPFRTLVAATKQTVWTAIRHRHIPFGHLVRETVPERRLGRFPIFQVVLTVEDDLSQGVDLPGVESTRLFAHGGRSKFDVFVNLVPDGGGYRGFLEYAADLFDEETAQRLADRFRTLLEDAVTHPERALRELRVIPAEERKLLDDWAAGPIPAVEAPPVHQAFATQAVQDPAVIEGARVWTYGEVAARADRLAGHLAAHGLAGPGRRVAICLERSAEVPVAVLGVLAAGACCVPIDPAYPADRIAFVLRDSAADAVLVDHVTRDRVPAPEGVPLVRVDDLPPVPEERPLLAPVTAEDPAYVLYTSGSTGRPKGVAIPHRTLAGLADWQQRVSGRRPGARTLQYAPVSFDVAFQELFATWAAGGAVVLVDDETRKDPQRLLDLLDEQRVDRMILPYVALQQLAEHAAAVDHRCATLREVITSGEQLYVTPAIRRFFAELTDASLTNQYGPTETHVVTAEPLTGDPAHWPERPTIGRPIDGARVQVLDDRLQPQPIGVPGEICVGARPVGLGYLGQPQHSAEKFVPDPFPPTAGGRESSYPAPAGPAPAPQAAADPERTDQVPAGQAPARLLYRTGDFGRVLPDGRIEFLGRRDDQVKIRGHRVELAEVESAVKAVLGVADAAVVAAAGAGESTGLRLIAFYLPTPRDGAEPDVLRGALRERLPAALVPTAFAPVSRLPLTASGKVDRASLARRAPDTLTAVRPVGTKVPFTARSATVERIAEIWAQLLGVDAHTLGPDDGFFDLGGDSLLAARLLLRLREELGMRLGLDAVYGASTLAQLAERVDGHRGGADPLDPEAARLPADIVPGRDGVPTGAAGPKTLLLTGATGFLGAFVLSDLIERTDATVHCLIRAADEADAGRRLRTTLEGYGLWSERVAQRARPLPGDLARPLLDLSPHTHEHLTRTVDAIYHCGASVNLAHPYSRLKPANVDGTAEILRLAAAHHPVPVHHVSTVGVFAGLRPGAPPIAADDPLTPATGLRHGYAQSKWAAERFVEQARTRGLTASIYRPTRICGATGTGACQTADFMWLLLKGCIQAGCYPQDLAVDFDLVPVDYVSATLVALSLDPATANRTFHLASGRPLPLAEAVAWLRSAGYRIAGVPTHEWVRTVEAAPDNAAFPLLEVMATAGDVAQAGTGPLFDATTTRAALRSDPPEVNADLFGRYVAYFRGTGFLPGL